jgi:hypothetical protein
MSGINDRQRVNALNSNAAWIAKNGDDATVGILSLENNAPASGAHVDNLQKAVNKAFEGVGATGESDTTINNYSSSNYVTNGDNRKVAIGKLDTQLKTTQDELDSVAILTTKGDLLVHNGTNYVRQAIGANDQVLTADSSVASGVKWAAGGAGGGGVKNFVTNFGAESGTSGWIVDSFAAASRPSGALTGVTTGITFAASSSSPLDGANSFTFAKDAANRQGRVVYTGLTFTPAYFAKVMNISVDMIVASGTFVAGTRTTDSDLIWYIQNVTDGTFIEPSSFKILSNSSTNSFQFTGTFQTAASATSYRLLGYVASTSAAAYTLRFDNVTVTPSTYAYGTPVTDWQAYTPTFTGFGTVTANQSQWRRVGDSIEIQSKFTSGTSTATEARVSFPSGIVAADTSKIPSIMHVGNMAYSAAQASEYHVLVEPSVSYVTFSSQSVSLDSLTKRNASSMVSSGQSLSFQATVPIQGWSSSVQTSDQTDTRVVVVVANNSNATQSITANTTNINFLTTNKDTHGAWSGSVFTVPVAGDYIVTTGVYAVAAIAYPTVYRNGSLYGTIVTNQANVLSNGSAVVPNCKVGDTLSIRGQTSITIAADVLQSVSFTRISGPNQIAASESVNAQYLNTAGTSITTSYANIPFPTRVYDSHNAFSTPFYTAPISGKYEVTVLLSTASVTVAATGVFSVIINQAGSASVTRYVPQGQGNGSANVYMSGGSVTFNMLAGDTIAVQALCSTATTLYTLATGSNFISIKRVGN